MRKEINCSDFADRKIIKHIPLSQVRFSPVEMLKREFHGSPGWDLMDPGPGGLECQSPLLDSAAGTPESLMSLSFLPPSCLVCSHHLLQSLGLPDMLREEQVRLGPDGERAGFVQAGWFLASQPQKIFKQSKEAIRFDF